MKMRGSCGSISMARSNIDYSPADTHRAASIGPRASLAVLASAAALPAVVLLWTVPPPLLLPALGLLSLAIAGVLSLIAWSVRAEPRASHITLWDVAGAYAFIGFAAGILSRPEQVLEIFGVASGVR
jgi:hypothetical protein